MSQQEKRAPNLAGVPASVTARQWEARSGYQGFTLSLTDTNEIRFNIDPVFESSSLRGAQPLDVAPRVYLVS
jgi:hypothetical protein